MKHTAERLEEKKGGGQSSSYLYRVRQLTLGPGIPSSPFGPGGPGEPFREERQGDWRKCNERQMDGFIDNKTAEDEKTSASFLFLLLLFWLNLTCIPGRPGSPFSPLAPGGP